MIIHFFLFYFFFIASAMDIFISMQIYVSTIERVNWELSFRRELLMFLRDDIFLVPSQGRRRLRHFCILTAFHRSLFVPSCCSSSRLKVGQGGGTVTNHYVDIGRKKRKERPLGRERWWLIFVQTRLQTVWRERFRTIFKVASRKKRCQKNHESHARLHRNVIQFCCFS